MHIRDDFILILRGNLLSNETPRKLNQFIFYVCCAICRRFKLSDLIIRLVEATILSIIWFRKILSWTEFAKSQKLFLFEFSISPNWWKLIQKANPVEKFCAEAQSRRENSEHDEFEISELFRESDNFLWLRIILLKWIVQGLLKFLNPLKLVIFS